MDKILLGLTALGFAGFIMGLAGKSRTVKKKSMRKNEIYQVITVISLIVMLASAVIYAFIN